MTEDTQRQTPERADSTERDLERHSPFAGEASVMTDPAAIRDEISTVATEADAAAQTSGEHIEGLLYQPGYIYDPRSSPGGVEYYPGPVSGTGEQQK